MFENGKSLSMHNDAVYKGTYTHNGTLLKLHENAYTIGYSALLNAAGTAAGVTKFGNGVFLDASQQNNRVYVGAPTSTGAVPVFAGIMIREPAIASGYPVLNDEVSDYQKGMLVKDGYVIYKEANVYGGSDGDLGKVKLGKFVFPSWCMWVAKADGAVYFTPKSTVYKTSGDIMVGRVVECNPDDQSVTVHISTVLLSDTDDISGRTPTVTAGTPTNTEIPVTVEVGTNATVALNIKATSGGEYAEKDVFVTPVFNSDSGKYVAEYLFEGLTKNTGYTIKAVAISANGAVATTGTATTAND